MAAALTARATPAPRRRWSAVLLAALAALWLALAVGGLLSAWGFHHLPEAVEPVDAVRAVETSES